MQLNTRLLVGVFVVGLTSGSPVSAAADGPQERLLAAAERNDWPAVWQAQTAGGDITTAAADGMTALHWAAFHGRSDAARRLLEAGVPVDAASEYGVTPLQIAVSAPDAELTGVLLDAGADVHQRSAGHVTPLLHAARAGDPQVIARLLEAGAKTDDKERSGQTPLMWAAAAGNGEAVQALVDAEAQVDATSGQGFTALMFAARDGHPDVVRRLYESGAQINLGFDPQRKGGRTPRKGSTALTLAVESGHFELALQLVRYGADPNDQRSGFTPLHMLSWVRKPNRGEGVDGDPPPRGSGNVSALQFVRELAAAGADVNARLNRGRIGKAVLTEKGATPFLLAARTADVPLMKVLLEQGADPKTPNADGCTAPIACAGVGVRAVGEYAGTEPEVMDAIDYLLDLGLDLNTVDDNGETVLHGAAYRNYPLLVAHLGRRGVDVATCDHRNKYGWSPVMIAQGKRPGSFKPSPETVAALQEIGVSMKGRDQAVSGK